MFPTERVGCTELEKRIRIRAVWCEGRSNSVTMPYSAEISRDRPTSILFVLDQSRSMSDVLPVGSSKARFLSDVINNTIYTLVATCSKADSIRDYFDIAIL